jgi:hypothetical protein
LIEAESDGHSDHGERERAPDEERADEDRESSENDWSHGLVLLVLVATDGREVGFRQENAP